MRNVTVIRGGKTKESPTRKRVGRKRACGVRLRCVPVVGSDDPALVGGVVMPLRPVGITASIPQTRLLVLVPHDRTVEPVHQLVDGGVQIFVRLLDKDVLPLDVERYFGLLPTVLLLIFFDGQPDVDVDHLVEMPRHATQLGDGVCPQVGRDFEVMTADRQVHPGVSWLLPHEGPPSMYGSEHCNTVFVFG